MVERTRPLSRRALSKKAYTKTVKETLRTDEEAIQSSKMNSTTKKRRTWVEKIHTKRKTSQERNNRREIRCAYNNKTTKKKA